MGSNDRLEPTPPREMKEEEDLKALSLEFFGLSQEDSSAGANVERISRGQVEMMKLPAGWVSGAEKGRTEAAYSYKEFHPEEGPDSMICFFYRGRRAGQDSSKSFRDVLAKPPHALTASEIESIGQILRDKRDPKDFKMTSCRTEDVNGRRVLVVQGRYNEIQEDALAMLIDADKDPAGSAVQEIFFQAPAAD